MPDKTAQELIRERVVAAGGGGRIGDTGDTGDTGDPGTSEAELEGMLTQMRRMNRAAREADESELTEAKTERERDDIRYRMLWGDMLYRADVKRMSGRGSSKVRRARRALHDHIDTMNSVYGTNINYPQMLEEGDPIPEDAVPVHEIPTETQPTRVLGRRLMTPEELDQP